MTGPPRVGEGAGHKIYCVAFEMVGPVEHPEYYAGDDPIVAPADVPDEHWTAGERHDERAAALVQFLGLHKLAEMGELVRNIVFYEGTITDIQWREISR